MLVLSAFFRLQLKNLSYAHKGTELQSVGFVVHDVVVVFQVLFLFGDRAKKNLNAIQFPFSY